MTITRAKAQLNAALDAVESEAASTAEKVEMLTEIAMGLQSRPQSAEDLDDAVALYEEALRLCPAQDYLTHARITARMGTALQSIPSATPEPLERAYDAFDMARKVLKDHGSPEELAEVEMNFGLVQQSLAGIGRARITDAIAAYQRSLQTFDKQAHPKEFAILQNNLATAFLSIPFTDERSKMREALAVQSFEEGLQVVNLIDHPAEYAMLQNNLGNALQYASSAHAVENNLRALDAYDEALKVRTRETTPLEYANTVSNKANCLRNLPDDPEQPGRGNSGNLARAEGYYEEAKGIFEAHGDMEKVHIIGETLADLASEMNQSHVAGANGAGAQAQA